MRKPPDAIVIVDAQYEGTAIKEANSMGIPIVAIVDSNTNPKSISYPIPANDDSLRTIQLIIGSIADSILEIKMSSKDQNKKLDSVSSNNTYKATAIVNDEEE